MFVRYSFSEVATCSEISLNQLIISEYISLTEKDYVYSFFIKSAPSCFIFCSFLEIGPRLCQAKIEALYELAQPKL